MPFYFNLKRQFNCMKFILIFLLTPCNFCEINLNSWLPEMTTIYSNTFTQIYNVFSKFNEMENLVLLMVVKCN